MITQLDDAIAAIMASLRENYIEARDDQSKVPEIMLRIEAALAALEADDQ